MRVSSVRYPVRRRAHEDGFERFVQGYPDGGERIDLGGLSVADRSDPEYRVHGYTADAYLGIDVLRIDRKADPSSMPTLTAPVPASWFTTAPA
jgi:hypothetical protein